jgi:hypothetical protein
LTQQLLQVFLGKRLASFGGGKAPLQGLAGGAQTGVGVEELVPQPGAFILENLIGFADGGEPLGVMIGG